MKKGIISMLICFIMVLCIFPISAYAEGGSEGTPITGGGTGGYKQGDETGIGPGNCYGFAWKQWSNGTTKNTHFTQSSVIKYANGNTAGTPKVDFNGYKAWYLIKNVNKGEWKLYSWRIWKSSLGTPGQYHNASWYPYGMWNASSVTSGHYAYGAAGSKLWEVTDVQLVEILQRDGWTRNDTAEWYTHSDGRKLDVVWRSESDDPQVPHEVELPPEITEGGSVESIKTVTSSKHGNVYSDSRDAESVFENPTTQVPYEFKSGDGEHSYYNLLTASTIWSNREAVYRTETWTETDGDGNTTEYSQEVFDHWEYWFTSGKTMTRSFSYSTEEPPLQPILFTPFNLNRNGVAQSSDYVSYYGYADGPDMKMSVDNKQSITQNWYIQMLDTNDAIPFTVTVNNSQLGIPTESQGGWELLDSRPSFSQAMGWGKETMSTGYFSTPGKYASIDGDVSDDVHWDGNLTGKITGGDLLTIKEDGGAEQYANSFYLSKSPGWMGGSFSIKNIKVGNYYLDTYGTPWWEIEYQEGRYWTYGVHYKGMVTLSDIQAPTTVDNAGTNYREFNYSGFVQPFMCGYFQSKTVGGNIG
mgnify:CR=1 FL=1